ncbi:MAG TPA: monofunctional biosynthetic peptidoglycan transglycosylase [Azoarcus taiwanensis]|uniref:Biosynthetic peptidoglycan transglycosylase n=1 Tax=Azoarcus taiwanensis TaxID=666964 RepID=A0A972F8K9_9RHOO|nr:monofunctional biosynthetic peptidoglycan transglycosylase [Azoarcus taiwanensis]NMG03665.1 monofunctional biosynthetic peptidoglycan transglycosylase [Azoarcus taiwanensis]HRQ56256.1 monofunctional biosynthetic peptidoglycan transglycosylase [Azoarcus taiwanensis]
MKRAFRFLGRILAVLLLAFVLVQAWFFAHVLWWEHNNPTSTRFMRLQLAELRERDPQAQLRHEWVPYERISVHLKRAVVAAEDDRFMQHQGFDWHGIQHAIERNRARGTRTAGGSTISQQLAKNLFLSPKRSYLRKGQEAIITVMIEQTWDKRRILEVYLNVVEWGEGVFGAEAAAQHYFRVSADRLGPGEASRLAVKLPNPRRYEREFGPRMTSHAERVRQRMRASRIPAD